ncbi:conserved hypothetical protein (DUF3880) [Synechococcus sp. Minos11]|uniref:CgeB family protein n=1 Tax=Synechococcus sp. Minos11 TaxID=221341 RepID=UPI0016448053|nr:glycosyltransferase [Synechococcus sp. Minos11]QNJ07679.1 conserved hypothetical protein (DUF3880) [Synechococcus sp. Minos11]
MRRLLLIGDTSKVEALGSKLLKGMGKSSISREWEVFVIYTSPDRHFSPSMNSIQGKIFYRLADKRSMEWFGFQEKLKEDLKEINPDLVIVTGILPLAKYIFKEVEKRGGTIVNYLTDDPWNRIHKRRLFLNNIPNYDHIFSTKTKLIERLLDNGARSASWLPFAYDPELHYPVKSKINCDVVFVGTGARERLTWLNSLNNIPNIQRHIYGNDWEKVPVDGWKKHKAVIGDSYCQVINSAKVVLGLVREANGDLSTDRSYEIGAIGGCGIYQDTIEHRKLLKNYPDIGFFANTSQLRENVSEIVQNESLQIELRMKGLAQIRINENTYASRLDHILSWAKP